MKNLTLFINQLLPFLFSFAILGGLVILLNGCAASAEYSPEKMDSPLNQKIRSMDDENSDMSIQFTGKAKDVVNEQMKKELQDAGINIETVAGDIFTANGTAGSIKKASLLDFIVYLELAKKLDLK